MQRLLIIYIADAKSNAVAILIADPIVNTDAILLYDFIQQL
jgi:hypothetical protein